MSRPFGDSLKPEVGADKMRIATPSPPKLAVMNCGAVRGWAFDEYLGASLLAREAMQR
jgi:hypothetical protein